MNEPPAECIDRWFFERPLWQLGLMQIAGVDEVGRGPLAGPVVAAAVILPREWDAAGMPPALEGLNDSKQLSESRREAYFTYLQTAPEVSYAIACIGEGVIDEINILQATHRAMNEALARLGCTPQHVLVDGTRVRSMTFPHTAIVKGDSRSYSIAAASVMAKVTRDRLMLQHDAQWPEYGFAIHKGYPTPRHLAAIKSHGPCPIHRMSFAPLKKPRRASTTSNPACIELDLG